MKNKILKISKSKKAGIMESEFGELILIIMFIIAALFLIGFVFREHILSVFKYAFSFF